MLMNAYVGIVHEGVCALDVGKRTVEAVIAKMRTNAMVVLRVFNLFDKGFKSFFSYFSFKCESGTHFRPTSYLCFCRIASTNGLKIEITDHPL